MITRIEARASLSVLLEEALFLFLTGKGRIKRSTAKKARMSFVFTRKMSLPLFSFLKKETGK